MNLIVHSSPKNIEKSLGGVLAKQLADRLGGETQIIFLYDSKQGYFNYESNDEWINLFISAKNIIFPVPMWNFSIPAALKDFFDYITKQGKLWAIDKQGNFIGLLSDRPAYIIMTSGGDYPSGSPRDFVVPYLKMVLEFVGIKTVKDFRVSGVTKSEKLIADKMYLENKSHQMFKAFNL